MQNKYIGKLKDIILDGFVNKNVKVYLFGSRARGDADMRSDVDIAVESNEKDPQVAFLISLLKEKIEQSDIPYHVELVDLTYVSPEFRSEIMKDAILWKG